jgi:hypothetical protein
MIMIYMVCVLFSKTIFFFVCLSWYFETFSPLVKPTTIRIILALAIQFRWTTRQLTTFKTNLTNDKSILWSLLDFYRLNFIILEAFSVTNKTLLLYYTLKCMEKHCTSIVYINLLYYRPRYRHRLFTLWTIL